MGHGHWGIFLACGLGSPGPNREELGPKKENKFFEDNSSGIWNLANPRAPWGGSLEGASDERKAKSGGPFSCQNRGVLGPLASTGRFAPGRNWCEDHNFTWFHICSSVYDSFHTPFRSLTVFIWQHITIWQYVLRFLRQMISLTSSLLLIASLATSTNGLRPTNCLWT